MHGGNIAENLAESVSAMELIETTRERQCLSEGTGRCSVLSATQRQYGLDALTSAGISFLFYLFARGWNSCPRINAPTA